MTSMDDVE